MDLGLHEIADPSITLEEQQSAEVEHPDKPTLVVDHIDKEDLADTLRQRAQNAHDLVDGGVLVDGDQLGLHESAGRVLWVGEEGLDLAPVLAGHGLDDILGHIFGKIGDDIRSVIRRHLLNGLRKLLRQQVLGEIITKVIGQLLHEIGDPRDVESLEQRWPEFVGKHAEKGGEISRVGAPHKLVEGNFVTVLDEVLDPRGCVTQTIRGEVYYQRLRHRLCSVVALHLVNRRIGHCPSDARIYSSGRALSNRNRSRSRFRGRIRGRGRDRDRDRDRDDDDDREGGRGRRRRRRRGRGGRDRDRDRDGSSGDDTQDADGENLVFNADEHRDIESMTEIIQGTLKTSTTGGGRRRRRGGGSRAERGDPLHYFDSNVDGSDEAPVDDESKDDEPKKRRRRRRGGRKGEDKSETGAVDAGENGDEAGGADFAAGLLEGERKAASKPARKAERAPAKAEKAEKAPAKKAAKPKKAAVAAEPEPSSDFASGLLDE